MLPSKCFIYSFTGEHDVRVVEGYEQIISVDKIIIHPDYDAYTLDYDVALIKLKKPINFTRNVRPVCLPTMDFAPGTKCFVTGWGATIEKGNGSQVRTQLEMWKCFNFGKNLCILTKQRNAQMI